MDPNHVITERDQPLDIKLAACLGVHLVDVTGFEHDHVAPARFTKMITDLVHENMIATNPCLTVSVAGSEQDQVHQPHHGIG